MTLNRSQVPCGDCRLCCRGDVIMLMPNMGDDISSYEHETIPGLGSIIKKGKDGNCIYLGLEGCTIHERAPAICRVFDCRRWFLSKTRAERRNMVRLGLADKEVFEAGRQRIPSLAASDRELPTKW